MHGPTCIFRANLTPLSLQEPNNAPWHTANHGLVRGVIRVTSAAARDDLELISRVDRGHAAAGSVALADGWAETGDIVVEASSPGFAAVQVTNGLRRSCRFVLLLIHFTPESLIFIFGASISETRMRPNPRSPSQPRPTRRTA